MTLTGRTYIFVAATLLLLAGSLRFYSDYAQTPQGQVRLQALKSDLCQTLGIETGGLRFGCHPDLIAPSRRIGDGPRRISVGQ